MKHATSRLLFAYWDEIRGERDAPDRSQVEPGRIRHLLGDTFILGARPADAVRFRLAGTRCSALFGRDLQGVDVRDGWAARSREELDRLLAAVLHERLGVIAGASCDTASGGEFRLELLLLPLRHVGGCGRRAIGAISPASAPDWARDTPLRPLSLTSWRVIRTDRSDLAEHGTVRESALARRARFVVLEGGLAT